MRGHENAHVQKIYQNINDSRQSETANNTVCLCPFSEKPAETKAMQKRYETAYRTDPSNKYVTAEHVYAF